MDYKHHQVYHVDYVLFQLTGKLLSNLDKLFNKHL